MSYPSPSVGGGAGAVQPQPQQSTLPATPAAQLRATAATLETDLRNLCAEARRKYPDLQASAERAMVKLRAVATQQQPDAASGATKAPIDVLQSESVLRPFLLACSSKSSKLCTLALASIQRLVSLTPLSPRLLATVMGTLRIQAESDDQTVQIKVLQTLLLTISPAAVECGELLRGSLLQALSICFRLFLQRKSAPIHHTAFAALRQLVALLFERVSWQSAQGLMWQQQSPQLAAAAASELGTTPVSLLPPPLDQLSHEAQNAYLLFQDLCILAAGPGEPGAMQMQQTQQAPGNAILPGGGGASGVIGGSSFGQAAAASTRPRWLTTLSASIPPEVCIELLENIVSGNLALFRAQPVFFANLVQRDLCALLLRLLRCSFDFPIVLRLVRLALVVLKAFHALLVSETECVMSLFLRMTHASFPLWHRVLVLEATLQLLRSSSSSSSSSSAAAGNGVSGAAGAGGATAGSSGSGSGASGTAGNDKMAYWLFHTFDLTPAQRAEAAALAAGVPASSIHGVVERAPQANPNQTRIFTSLLHALSRIVIQTGTALCDGAGTSGSGGGAAGSMALSGSGGAGLLSGQGSLQLAVGNQGFSSSSSALLTSATPTPSVNVTVPTTPTPGSTSSSSSSGVFSFSSPMSRGGSGAAGGEPNTLSWRLYSSKGNRGLDLLNLDQDLVVGGGGGGGGAAAGAGSGASAVLSGVVGSGGGSGGSTASSGGSGGSSAAGSMYEESYVVTLSMECIVTVVNSLASLAKTNEKWGGGGGGGGANVSTALQQSKDALASSGSDDATPASPSQVAPSSTDAVSAPLTLDANATPVVVSVLRLMASACCLPMLGALSFLLSRTASADEAQIQHVLMCYQSFTNTAGVLELTRARDMFLNNLCAFALPHSGLLPRDEPPAELMRTLFPSSFAGAAGAASSAGGASSSSSASSSAGGLSLALLRDPEAQASFAATLSRLLLSAKNIQALKALFNVAHCLGALLGPASWLVLLETFQALDTMIHVSSEVHYRLSSSQHLLGAGGGGGGHAPGAGMLTREQQHAAQGLQELCASMLPHQTEIGIMAAALSRLFESTRYLDDRAVTHVLSALGTLNLSALANAATNDQGDTRPGALLGGVAPSVHATHPSLGGSTGGSAAVSGGGGGITVGGALVSAPSPQSIRMFALVNLVATLEHNLFRLTSARLWDIGVGHLTCVINHRNADIRQFGVAALTRIAVLALGKSTTYVQPTAPPQAAASFAPVSADDDEDGGGAVRMSSRRKSSTPASSDAAPPLAVDPLAFHSSVQRGLLEPFAELFRSSKYADTREQILLSLFHVLQAAGQGLGPGGWKVVMQILQNVVQQPPSSSNAGAQGQQNGGSSDGDSPSGTSEDTVAAAVTPASATPSASFIHVGFNSVQLIANDFLEIVPFTSLQALIDVVRAYCAQHRDTNISFTSIGLLWRISDYIHKMRQSKEAMMMAGGAANGVVKDETIVSPSSATVAASSSSSPSAPMVLPPLPSAADLSDALADALMQQVFTSLVSLSVDARTEVRNSAVKTLHNALATHAARMSLPSCVHVLRSLVLPLLSRLLRDKSLESTSGGAGGAASSDLELGKDKATGKSVMMLIHYSRDTAAKQWDETRVFAMQGTARVIKGYVDNMLRTALASEANSASSGGTVVSPEVMAAFETEWLVYLELNLAALANRSPEVSLAALNAVMDLAGTLFASGGGSASAASGSGSASGVGAVGAAKVVQTLWTPVLERFYVRGVLHALTQHRHIEWLEDRERALEAERKAARSSGAPAPTSIDHASSPFPTSFGDLSAEECWKTWLKTQTHLLGHLLTLVPLVRRGVEMSPSSSTSAASNRNDLVLLLHLSHVLVKTHSSYTEQRARALYAQRKASGSIATAADEPELSMVDRKETPLQAAHLKLLESLCVLPAAAGAPTTISQQQAAPSSSPSSASASSSSLVGSGSTLPPALWEAVFEQLLSYLVSDWSGTEEAEVEQQMDALMKGLALPVRNSRKGFSASLGVDPAAPLQFASTSFAKKVLRVLDRLYCSVAPGLVRATQFPRVLMVLQLVLQGASSFLRDQGYQELCEEAVAALIHMLDAGLPSVNASWEIGQGGDKAVQEEERARLRQVWHTVVAIFASFLAPPAVASVLASMDPSSVAPGALFALGEPVLLPARTPLAAVQRVWENLQIALVGCLVRVVLPQVAHVPEGGHTLQALVSFLNIGFGEEDASSTMNGAAMLPNGQPLPPSDAGASIAPATNELLSHSCLMALFLLSRAGAPASNGGGGPSLSDSPYGAPLSVAQLSAPLLLHRCESILRSYLLAERLQAPNVPLARCRREELAFVLRELCTLQMHPQVADMLLSGADGGRIAARAPPADGQGSRAHLLKLFPVLCQCITMREPELRELLRDVFQHASVELGLQAAPL